MRTIRYFRVGYVLILLTPALSLVVLALGVLALAGIQDYLLPIMVVTAWNSSIVILLIIGIALYMYGYLRREATDVEAKVVLLFSVFLVLWGVLTYLFSSGFYRDLIDWSMNPGMRTLTIWDYMEYWTWELKAILWIGSGLLFAATSLMKVRALGTLDYFFGFHPNPPPNTNFLRDEHSSQKKGENAGDLAILEFLFMKVSTSMT